MELLSPAGNMEKLEYAYRYGADAVYIGIDNFSLRTKADNFRADEYEFIREVKGAKKLYCALNIYFHNNDIKLLQDNIPYILKYPFDAFIISDIGIVPIIKKHFPDIKLHLSTQANCINSEAVKMYRDIGFSRVILGREAGLKEISEIKKSVPEIEIETFVHGAMCLAYSGRCFLSSYMTGRSANSGDCAHSCRWQYRVLEEKERAGEYFPVLEGDNFTTILSSKDLCMIDHIKDLKEAGIDSLKIEGRMKSIYYTAVVTRAYRKMLDHLSGNPVPNIEKFREELFKVSHREFSTGFFYGKDDIETSTEKSYLRSYTFLGLIGKEKEKGTYHLKVKNQINENDVIEYIGPDVLYIEDKQFSMYDENGNRTSKADHGKEYTLKTEKSIKPGFIIRKRN